MGIKKHSIIGLAIVSTLSLLITFNNCNSQQGVKDSKYISIDPLPSSTKPVTV